MKFPACRWIPKRISWFLTFPAAGNGLWVLVRCGKWWCCTRHCVGAEFFMVFRWNRLSIKMFFTTESVCSVECCRLCRSAALVCNSWFLFRSLNVTWPHETPDCCRGTNKFCHAPTSTLSLDKIIKNYSSTFIILKISTNIIVLRKITYWSLWTWCTWLNVLG